MEANPIKKLEIKTYLLRLIKRIINWLVGWQIIPFRLARCLSDCMGLRHV
jgi:hypothetical protein